MLVEHPGKGACHPGKVEGVACAFSGDEELLLALVGDEVFSQFFSMSIHTTCQVFRRVRISGFNGNDRTY